MTEQIARPHPGSNAERLAQDRELCERLQLDGFRGPRFDALVEDLWLYGWRVLRSWMQWGEIIARCGENDIQVPAWYTEVDMMTRLAELRDERAADSVATAVAHFTETILPRGFWDPNRGASMRTYFLRSCLCSFRNVCKRWATRRRRQLGALADWSSFGDRPSAERGAEHRVVLRAELQEALADASWQARAICALIYQTGSRAPRAGSDGPLPAPVALPTAGRPPPSAYVMTRM
ncbi:hypothetical protein ACXNSR_00410 [Streptomyces sp. NC-S4]